ncbi:MAG: helix-turn-helix transcriptional regulator [Candidatus Gastranaerophilales bacterium]
MGFKKKLGHNIKEVRIQKGLTQEALSEKINISAKSLSQIELGNNFVSATTLENICLTLNVNPKTLFSFDDIDVDESDLVNKIVNLLRNNSHLTKTIYKILLALS